MKLNQDKILFIFCLVRPFCGISVVQNLQTHLKNELTSQELFNPFISNLSYKPIYRKEFGIRNLFSVNRDWPQFILLVFVK